MNTSESPIPGLTAIQYERLMQTLNGEAEGKRDSQTTGQSKQAVANMAGKCTTNFDKVIDSGANEHIVCEDKPMLNEKWSNHLPVQIPNGPYN